MNRRSFIDMKVQLPRVAGSSSASLAAAAPYAEPHKRVQHPLKTYGSGELFDGSTEVGIEHAGSLYRLKITRQGKLILNK
ncbi:hemin uptake protein HemP [Phyllobacterium phragmitis]|uniref:Hemin uptake protein HemP n=1 Tax=Phyllobacterium phragmitis TaxID=2670329 RepID=A0A2S9IJF0_9HYPH|nr:hemin uptake protein HemP [Phyllobacterium phragmitis]PRD40647.1 hemin uptake protein HemP [Phyllobacterium phragmitis]